MEKPVKDIRLIAIDIDGTLLTPDGQITPRTRMAIEAAQRAGIIVTLATARRYFSTGAIATELGLELPLIVYDGALIVNHPARTVLYSRALAAGVAQQVVDVFRQFAVQPVVQPCDCMQEEVWTGPAEYDHLELATYITLAKGRLRRLPYAQLCAGQADPLRVVAFASEECIQRLLPAVSALACSLHSISLGSYGCAELAVMHPACSKASGVAALASYYNIPLEQVMAIGDNTNDREMLRSAGWSVAMGQASEEVKAAAKAVTGTNLEDGVAQAIERYALLQDFQPVRSRSDSSV
ncbi:MAG TPA: Cof-type HAD-IIB family hydrolase [Ktedonobacteraceae bacterium]|nr:Cof-type HAD-IIB family hydrolase [Ktedonobacteraceae bacterium]